MTKKELEQYRALLMEIDIHTERLRGYDREVKSIETQYDVVHGSSPEPPYCLHPIAIAGAGDSATLRHYRKSMADIRQTIRACKARAVEELANLEGYIASVDDSEIRSIMVLKYVQGVSWEAIAERMGTDGDGSTERKKVERYLSRIS